MGGLREPGTVFPARLLAFASSVHSTSCIMPLHAPPPSTHTVRPSHTFTLRPTLCQLVVTTSWNIVYFRSVSTALPVSQPTVTQPILDFLRHSNFNYDWVCACESPCNVRIFVQRRK